MTAAPNVAPAPPPVADAPPAPVPMAPVDPLTFTDDAPALSEATTAILAMPVDPELVEMRAAEKDGPDKIMFVPWSHYQAVLLKAFGPGGYKLVPRSVPRTEGNMVTWVGALFVRPPGGTKFQFIKEAKGECGTQGGRMGAGNAAEGAQSDCLVKCCKALGIFMELFDPRWRRAWEDKYKAKYQSSKRQAAWPAARAGGAPSAPAATAPALSATPAETETATSTDTGEAATPEQLDAIKGRVKVLKWKVGYLRIWFDERFGLKAQDPARLLGALTAQQADTAFLLLNAFGTNVYETLLGQQQEKELCL